MKRMLFIIFVISSISLFSELNFKDIKNSYYESYEHETVGKYTKAIRDLEDIYNHYKETYTVNYRLGWLYYLEKNYANSLLHLEKALTIVPSSVEVLNTMMLVYSAQLDWGKVEEIGLTALKISSYDINANYWYSIALTNQKKYEDAVKINRKMLSIYPVSINFLRQLGINLFYLSKYKEALNNLEAVIILNPDEKIGPMR